MQKAKKGDRVKVHYSGRLINGKPFDSSQGKPPLEFELGSGAMIRGFDEALLEMQSGEKKTVHIPVMEAYGQRTEDLVLTVGKDRFPPGLLPEVGMTLQMRGGQGQQVPVQVLEVREELVILDANHPLAGEELVFEIELVEIL